MIDRARVNVPKRSVQREFPESVGLTASNLKDDSAFGDRSEPLVVGIHRSSAGGSLPFEAIGCLPSGQFALLGEAADDVGERRAEIPFVGGSTAAA